METNYIGLISLALILWAVYELGKSNGAHAVTTKLQKAAGLLFAAKQTAEAEAMQCKFACELFKSALEAQQKSMEALLSENNTLRDERDAVEKRVIELEASLFNAHLLKGG